tara:strand:- start:73 stop:615 length:543 start_codon:yes stop_codon:yes gene_type:complete
MAREVLHTNSEGTQYKIVFLDDGTITANGNVLPEGHANKMLTQYPVPRNYPYEIATRLSRFISGDPVTTTGHQGPRLGTPAHYRDLAIELKRRESVGDPDIEKFKLDNKEYLVRAKELGFMGNNPPTIGDIEVTNRDLERPRAPTAPLFSDETWDERHERQKPGGVQDQEAKAYRDKYGY